MNGFKVAMIIDNGISINIYYAHNNYQGLPRQFSDANQLIVWSGQFKPYGGVGKYNHLFINKEINSKPKYSRFYEISSDNFKDVLGGYLSQNLSWGYTFTCADWASDFIKDTTNEDVNADDLFGFETPREISESIRDLEKNNPSSYKDPIISLDYSLEKLENGIFGK